MASIKSVSFYIHFFISFQSCSAFWISLAISKTIDSNHCNIRAWFWWQSNPGITPKRQREEFCIQAQLPLFCTILNLFSSLHVATSSCFTPFLTTCNTGPLLQAIKTLCWAANTWHFTSNTELKDIDYGWMLDSSVYFMEPKGSWGTTACREMKLVERETRQKYT